MARILIVDDSVFMRMTITNMVKEGGHEAIVAFNGREGLEKVRSEKPDCVITDLNMPEMQGTELIAALKEEGNTTPIIVNSADVQESTRQQCLDLGIFGFFNKPLKKEAVLESVNQALSLCTTGNSQ